jgi:hypothetical protein
MTTRTFTDKNGNEWSWEETSEVVKAVKNLVNFAGNYKGPLYAPHPDLKNEQKN